MYVGEMIGREGQAKAQRKSASAVDLGLISLLEKDREGMRAVMLAREANMITDKSVKPMQEKAVATPGTDDFSSDDERSLGSGKNAFTAQVVKQLGFDPTIKAGRPMKRDDSVLLKKVQLTFQLTRPVRADPL
jgi:minichromosome maintenance protein 10